MERKLSNEGVNNLKTYAQERLQIGIYGVGTIVLLSLFFIFTSFEKTIASYFEYDFKLTLVSVLIIFQFFLTPFEIFGGWLIPSKHKRIYYKQSEFLKRYLPNTILILAFKFVILFSYFKILELYGTRSVLGVFLLICLFLHFFRKEIFLAFSRSSSELHSDGQTVIVDNNEFSFTGSVIGFLRPIVVIPKRWLGYFDQKEIKAIIKRRLNAISNGSYRQGVIAAIAWNFLGFNICLRLQNGKEAWEATLNTFFFFQIWTFFSLFILPRFNRRAVYASDKNMKGDDMTEKEYELLLRKYEFILENEETRKDSVESVFHPIPNLLKRIEALKTEGKQNAEKSFFQIARNSLFTALAGASFISRAVHCNSGKPDLWVIYPGD